jgi:acyl dehydratase
MNLPPPKTVGPITRTDIVRYQGASGDFNPIHHDEAFAIGAGMPAPLGIGMLHAGMLAAWATDHYGPEKLRGVRIRWKRPVWPGDSLTISGELESEDEGRFTLALQGANQDGVVVVLGWTTFVR